MTKARQDNFSADRCPLCGQGNQCAMATLAANANESVRQAACDSCWCRELEIPAAVLARIPEPARGRACVCPTCCNAGMSEPSEGVTKTLDPGKRAAIALEASGHRVLISQTGAQVLSWHVQGEDILWTASAPEYLPGKPVRGGVPVVFPWFGDHKSDASLPAHGFARSLQWLGRATGPAQATFTCTDSDATRAMWNHPFRAELTVTLSDTLTIAMRVTNTGEREFRFEQALHTYFAVGDIHTASVHGLQDVPFVEHAREPEGEWDVSATIRFRAETDRVFQQVPDELSLHATKLGRKVSLRTSNAGSAIVWNPWPNKTARLSQMHQDDWRSFACIESANVGESQVTLAPGAHHEMTLTLSIASD